MKERALGLLLGMAALAAHARVVDFHSDIRIARNGELTVTERITLEVDARQPHSVLRRELRAPAVVADVIRNGHPEPWSAEREAGAVRLRVGKPGEALAYGRHTYQIAYRSERGVRFLERHDELTWRLGPGERITAEFILPASVPARELRAEPGRHAQSFVRDGRAAFRTLRAVAPHEEVTVALRFPKHVVQPPPAEWHGLALVAALLALNAFVLHRLARIQ